MRESRTITVRDASSGLVAFIVLDSLALGPAAGGVRTWRYDSEKAALSDATRLARAMTIKCAISGLDAGGGKAVVMDHPGLDRPAAFRHLGAAVEALDGAFRTAGDVGTTASDLAAMASATQWVHEDESGLTEAVADGLVACLSAACRLTQPPLTWPNLSATVQGCGAIGGAVARGLAAQGLTLTVADLDHSRASQLALQIGAQRVSHRSVLSQSADILAPCALGGLITRDVAHALDVAVICGAANNILASVEAEVALKDRGIMWVPDVLASAGAVVRGIARTVMGLDDPAYLVRRLGDTTGEVLAEARERDTLASTVIASRVRQRMREAGVALGGLDS
ncbi:MAG: Glu/Leu/Phe/Val dehydrogenase dimerization domain-containing protein [Myxococcota bacterium]